jgi:excisionase family DNA binding protein
MKTKKQKCLDEFMTVEEAAERKKGTPQGIRKAIKEQRLAAERKGRQWLILRTDFEKFMKEAA